MIGEEATMRSPLSHTRHYAGWRFALTMEEMSFRGLRSFAFAAVLALLVVVPAVGAESETARSGGVQLTIPDGWSKVDRASWDDKDPRTLLVVGTKGVRPLASPTCQVAAYRIPADGAVVVVIGWRDSIGGPSQLNLKLRRNTFDCFDGRGAASQVTRNSHDYQVSVMVGDKADSATVAAALAVARSFARVR